MVKVTCTAKVAVMGNSKGDAKATASVAAKVMAETKGDSGRDRRQQQQR